MASRCIRIAVTGSIGMGKSSVTKHFAALGFPVFDADKCVHNIYSENKYVIESIQTIVPTCVVNGSISRSILSTEIKSNPSLLNSIESIVHPVVAEEREIFYNNACSQGHLMAIYDIPLLYEKEKLEQRIFDSIEEKKNRKDLLTITYKMVDYVVLATASANAQKERVLSRGTMDLGTFELILKKQVDDGYKRKLCDYAVHTDIGEGYTCAKSQVAHVVEDILSKNPNLYKDWLSRDRISWGAANCLASKSNSASNETPDATSIDTIIFDLDDTLIDSSVLLGEAHSCFLKHVEQTMPCTHVDLMQRLKTEFNNIKNSADNGEYQHSLHNYYALRKIALSNIATQYGEEGAVEEAMEVFTSKRTLAVISSLYPDALECIHYLRKFKGGFKIGVMSNAFINKQLLTEKYPEFMQLFDFWIQASDVGALKPSPIPFITCINTSNSIPRNMVYVGDTYSIDVVGARSMSMHSCWLNRSDEINDIAIPKNERYISNLDPVKLMAYIDAL